MRNNREWPNSRVALSNHHSAVQETHSASSELNVHLVQREPNVPRDQLNSSSRGANASQHPRGHNRSSDAWKFRARNRRFVENPLR